MKNFLKYNFPSIIWAAFILYLCLLPGKDLPRVNLWEADKIGHFCVYFLLAMLTFYGWKKQSSIVFLHRNIFISVTISLALYGIALEAMQEVFTADRHFDILDATVNTIGAAAGSLISVKVFK